MADKRHVDALEKILNDRIAERRAMAAGYPEAENPPAVAAKIAATQIEIESIEKAVAHEKALLPRAPAATTIIATY